MRQTLALPLAALVAIGLTGCISPSTSGPKDGATPLPSRMDAQLQAAAKAAGTSQVTSTTLTKDSANLTFVKGDKSSSWTVGSKGAPKKSKATGPAPAAAKELSALGLGQVEDAARTACGNEKSTATTAVLANGHTLSTITCGSSPAAKSVLVDGKAFGAIADRFSKEGVERALAAARDIAPDGAPLTISLPASAQVIIVVPSTKGPAGTTCEFPRISLPTSAAGALALTEPTACLSKQADAAYFAALKPVQARDLDPEKVIASFEKAAKAIGVELGSCSVATITSPSEKHPKVTIGCEKAGKRVTGVQPIA